MKTTSRHVVLSVCLMALACICRADPLEEGRALYKAGRYAEAVVKLEQATREQPNNAKAWWQLNFAYNKLNRYADALRAVQKAGQIDPTYSFTPEGRSKYEEVLGRLQKKAGGAPSAPTSAYRPSRNGATTSGSGGGNITQQLIRGDVYVQRGIPVDVERLRRVARELRPTVVKFVVFNSRSNSRTLAREADRIRDYLKDYINQGQGYVIASSRAGVAVSTTSLSKREIEDLTRQIAPQMEAGNYTRGLELLARGLAREKAPRAPALSATNGGIPRVHRGPNWLLIFLVLAGGAVVVILIARAIANARAMAARREPLERLKSDVIGQMNYLDDSLPLLDAGSAARVREARIAAGTKLDEASRIITRARSDRELMRAQSLLDQAQMEVARGRAVVDRAMSGEKPSTAAETATAAATRADIPPVSPSAPSSGPDTDWEAIPENERGVCFFCSRPSLLSELRPVTVNLDGQPQKVLACPTDYQTIKTGQMPSIRAFNDGGRYVPWYAYDRYDPYRDYYDRGYGSNLLADMVMLNMINNMFWNWHHPVGWGWGGGYGHSYVFYHDHPVYHDYYSERAASSGSYEHDSDIEAAGTDFLQGTGGDIGGADFVDTGHDES